MVSEIQPWTELAARLPIHIDVPGHFFIAEDYIVVVNSINVCLSELNKRLFESSLDCELLVFASEAGSFKEVTGVLVRSIKKTKKSGGLAVAIIAGFAATVSFSETEFFEGLVKGLTGHELNHYQAGEEIGNFLRDMIVGILVTENDKLERIIPSTLNLDRALKAKSDLYAVCVANDLVRGIGFDDGIDFAVGRDRFAYHISKDRVRPVDSEFVIYETVVISPVDIDKDTQWELQDVTTKSLIRAKMRDERFKRNFLNGAHPMKKSKKDDRMVVCVEYKKQEKNGEIEVTDKIIVTVYSFNGLKFHPLPTRLQKNVRFSRPEEMPMEKLWGYKSV